MTRPIPILLYADVDPDIADGSTAWSTSVAEVLTHHPRVELTVLLQAPEQRGDLLSGSLRALPRTTVVEASAGGPMRPADAVDRIEELDRATPFAAIVLRGLAISSVAAGRPQLHGRLWPDLTDIPQRTADLTAETRRTLTDIAAASDLLLCQTPELRDHLESAIPPTERRTALLPPLSGIEPYLDRLAPARPAPRSTSRPHRLLVAGHDLKFLRPYLPWFTRVGIEVRIDTWHGYEDHDEDASRQGLDWADTILAEWCLGNATWYAEHRAHQRLVVRLHRMELTTPYPAALADTHPDALIVVSRHVGDELVEDHGWDPADVVTLPNAVDTLRLDRRKLPSAPRTLGMIGVLPKLKRLDRALDLLETLLRVDPRWRLRIAGLLPFDSSWVWARLDEQAYFADQLDRVRRSPRLRRAVSLDGPVADVATWLRQVGVILSPSDVESFHLAVAEGMASGAEPVIWPRLGAAELFPGPWSVADTAAAATRLTTDRDPQAGQEAAALVRARYAVDQIAPRLVEQVLG